MKRSVFAVSVLAVGLSFACKCHAGVFQPGEFVTYTQDNWGSLGSAASQLLFNHFPQVYPNGIQIGITGAAGNSAIFTTVKACLDYLSASGSPAPLDNDYLDPTSTSAGIFGGYVLALQFDVDFNDAGLLSASSQVLFGDLVLHDLTGTPAFNGLTVRQFLGEMNEALGGAAPPHTYDDMATLTFALTRAFVGGTPTQFAQDHLMILAECPGNTNRDAAVDVDDLIAVILAWGNRRTPPAACDADVDDSGVVDVDDLIAVILNWGACG